MRSLVYPKMEKNCMSGTQHNSPKRTYLNTLHDVCGNLKRWIPYQTKLDFCFSSLSNNPKKQLSGAEWVNRDSYFLEIVAPAIIDTPLNLSHQRTLANTFIFTFSRNGLFISYSDGLYTLTAEVYFP